MLRKTLALKNFCPTLNFLSIKRTGGKFPWEIYESRGNSLWKILRNFLRI
jgi:hypothetical protein